MLANPTGQVGHLADHERDLLRSDYLLLERKAHDVLKAGLTIDWMVAEAKDIGSSSPTVTVTPLTPEHVMGLKFSLAAQSEALSDA